MSKYKPWAKIVQDLQNENAYVDPVGASALAMDWATCAVGECLGNLKIPRGQCEEIATSYPEIETLGQEFHREISGYDYADAIKTLKQIRRVVRKYKGKILEQSQRITKRGI